MASSGEFIANALTIEYENPALTWNEITTNANNGKESQSVGEAETTAYGTTARTKIPGLNENSFSFTLLHNNTNSYNTRPQTLLQTVFNARTVVNWRIRPNGAATGRHEITFTGFISKYDTDYTSDDQVVTTDVEVSISGAITNAAQS